MDRAKPTISSADWVLQNLPPQRALAVWGVWHRALADLVPGHRLPRPCPQELRGLHRRIAAVGPEVHVDGNEGCESAEDVPPGSTTD